jgi:molybdopterin-guanine dinucleotide biosynthesis protein A
MTGPDGGARGGSPVRGPLPTVGAILQGGRSSRMGADKAFVVVDGVAMRDRVRAALAGVVDEIVQVGGADRGVDTVVSDEGDGPLRAVLALLHSGRGDRYVIAAVDQPLLDAPALRRLLEVDLASDGCVCFEDEPLPCVVRAGARDRLAALVARGERRMRALATTTLVPSSCERAAIVNINTRNDLAALKR